MSAYGSISTSNRPVAPLHSTLWIYGKRKDNNSSGSREPVENIPYLTLHHLTLETSHTLPGLVAYLHESFANELERGLTYPQEILQGEIYTQPMFEAYFFAADVLVAIIGRRDTFAEGKVDGSEIQLNVEEARGGRSWEECIAGFYYVKPNYPGRSSHICNAGFVVPSTQRAKGFGSVLARSYLHYGPRLGYEASVFNLVYVNNIASIKLWDALNFTRAGLIPRAGRLKKTDGSGEEYVDAIVFYKRFDTPNLGSSAQAELSSSTPI